MSGRESATYEIHKRTFRVAQDEGVALWELGVPSLELKAQPVAVTENRPMEPVEVSATAAVAVLDRTQVLGELTQLFAAQTGYDVSELESDFLLEADLGIDTVKQAEIAGLIRETYGMGQIVI